MLYDQIKTEMLTAQKAGDARLLGILRLIISELSYAQVDYKDGTLPDEVVFKVLAKEAKKRKEAVEIYEKAEAVDRAEQEKYELGIIEKYLPVQMSEVEVEKIVDEVALETGMRGGRLVGVVMGKLKGKVDGNIVLGVVMKKYQG